MHAPSVEQSGQTPSVKLGQSPSPELLCPMSRSSGMPNGGRTKLPAFVSSQGVEEEDGHVGNLPLLLPSYDPLFLSACLPGGLCTS